MLARVIGMKAVVRILGRFLGVLLLTCLAARAAAAEDLNYIRDAEIESTLRTLYTPILRAAGLDPAAVHIYLVNDARLNSFVAGGQNAVRYPGRSRCH